METLSKLKLWPTFFVLRNFLKMYLRLPLFYSKKMLTNNLHSNAWMYKLLSCLLCRYFRCNIPSESTQNHSKLPAKLVMVSSTLGFEPPSGSGTAQKCMRKNKWRRKVKDFNDFVLINSCYGHEFNVNLNLR